MSAPLPPLRRDPGRLALLVLPPLVLGLAALFVLYGSGFDTAYILSRRLAKLAAMLIGGVAVALSSVTFQTLAGNRILSPAVMGYEAVYLLLQSLLLLGFGAVSLTLPGADGNFLLSTCVMLGYSLLLHRWLFRGGKSNVWLLLLVGLVLTMVVGTFTQFVQLRISPGEFAVFQGFAQVSFDHVETSRLLVAGLLLVAACLLGCKSLPVLDVLSLGRDQAISLGVDHARELRRMLALIAVLVALSTSLIGPTAFMGIFVANIAYALAPAARHRQTLPLACLVAVGMFVIAQLMVEHLFNYKTSVGILINLVCGAAFLGLVLRGERRRGGPA